MNAENKVLEDDRDVISNEAKENLISTSIAISIDMKRNLINISKRLDISLSALMRIMVNESNYYKLELEKVKQ